MNQFSWDKHEKDKKYKVFISCAYPEDEQYKEALCSLGKDFLMVKTLRPGEIEMENPNHEEYIRRVTQGDYITPETVVVVLVGGKTFARKWVDWEISAALQSRLVGTFSGLLGICLPTHPDYGKTRFRAEIVPRRLVDNMNTGFAKFYDWTKDPDMLRLWVGEAFTRRVEAANRRDNSRAHMLESQA